jgi:copper transport protein
MIRVRIRPAMSPRLGAVAALAVVIVLAGATPAFAHATLLTTEPQPGGKLATSPRAITLRFSEPVEVALGGIRLFDGSGDRVVIGKPEHPNHDGNRVRASVPNLDDGTYVVTWRVTSEDAHPVQGAFTFQVGGKGSVKNAGALAKRLLANQGGSTAVGIVYASTRAVIFASLALLIGGVVFLAVVFPQGRDARRARMLVWAGWIGTVVATVAGIALEGVYASALSLTSVFDASVFGDVLETRYGRVSIVRLLVLAGAYPVLRVLLRRREGGEVALPRMWWLAAGAVGLGLSVTPGLAGHAASGDHVALAIPADAVHVLGMACWLGGLVMLVAVVLVRTDPQELRQGIGRYSAIALGAIVALVVTGAFQAWRQVGSFSALRDTDYGNLLIAKLVVFAALIVAAAFSREIVNRRFRPAPVDDDVADPEEDDDETEVRRLRRSVVAELVIAVGVLVVTAMLVNAAPARTVQTAPISMTLKSRQVWVDVVIAPGLAGPNDVHITALPIGDTITKVEDMSAQLVRPGSDLAPFDLPLQNFGPGHSVASLYDIPYSGEWRMVVRVRLGATDEVVLTGKFTVR